MKKPLVILSLAALSMSYTALANDASNDSNLSNSDNTHTTATHTVTNSNPTPGYIQPAPVTQQPGTTSSTDTYTTDTNNMQSSSANAHAVTKGGLGDEVVGIKVQAGDLNFRDPTGQLQNRNLLGFTAEMNASALFSNITGIDTKNLFLGPQIGFFYSHVGEAQANFWGTDSAALGSANGGANLFEMPLDLKVGGNVGPFRLAVHGGGNIFYRSVSNAVAMGYNPDTSSDSSWTILPNLGLDIEFGLTNAVALIIRPDLTFGGDNRLWSATAGVSIPLG